jgi:hypothetical protein
MYNAGVQQGLWNNVRGMGDYLKIPAAGFSANLVSVTTWQ